MQLLTDYVCSASHRAHLQGCCRHIVLAGKAVIGSLHLYKPTLNDAGRHLARRRSGVWENYAETRRGQKWKHPE